VCLCVKSRKNKKEGGGVGFGVGGAHEDISGVAFELFEMVVIGIGVSFAKTRQEGDWGASESFRKHKNERSLMFRRWKGR
jgi:hypothetical protein